MFTPQQIDQISFSQAKRAKDGYSIEEVDAFLEPLTEDYVTLYKENALLKSKMRVLVGKLEEYRKNEANMKDAVVNAQRAADKVIREAEMKAAQMLNNATAQAANAQSSSQANAQAAQAAAAAAAANAETLIAAENARVEEARKAANARINEIQEQMRTCIQALERIKSAAPAAAAAPAAPVAPVAPVAAPAKDVYDSNAVADEISQNLEALVGTMDSAPKADHRNSMGDTTSRFSNLNLAFGRNYDPTHK